MDTIIIREKDNLNKISENRQDGDVLIFEKGAWFFDEPWQIDKSITIVGAGKDKTLIEFQEIDKAMIKKGDKCLSFFDIKVVLKRNTGTTTFLEVNEGNLLASNCIFSGIENAPKPSGYLDFSFNDGIKFLNASVGRFFGCEFENFPGSAVDADNDSKITITNSTFYNNGLGACFKGSSKGVFYKNTLANNNSGFGIHCKSDVKAIENICQDNAHVGIRISSTCGLASRNICKANIDGILVSGSSSSLMLSNECYENRDSGISYMSSSSGTCQNNRCCQNGENGIETGDDASPTITGNICNENNDSGIRIMDHSKPNVSGNTCNNNGVCGIYKAGRARVSLEANTCEGNGREDFSYASATRYDGNTR